MKDFIERELGSKPYELLGDSWSQMLQYHEMFIKTKGECNEQWEHVHMPELLRELTPDLRCSRCHANLVIPDKTQVDGDLILDGDEDKFLCHCFACGNTELIFDSINNRIDTINYLNIRDGGEPEFETCYSCGNDMFNTRERVCFWCEEKLEFNECLICGEPLNQDDQVNDGLCGYHSHVQYKLMRD